MSTKIRLRKCHLSNALTGRNGRFALDCLCLTPTHVLSSDGHCLLLVAHSLSNDEEEFPDLQPRFLLHRADAKHAAAMCGDEGVEFDIGGDRASLSNGTAHMTLESAKGEFPGVRELVPDFSDGTALTFDFDNLVKGLSALRKASISSRVTLRVLDSGHAVGFQTEDGCALLVMPFASGGMVRDVFADIRQMPVPLTVRVA